MSDQPLYLSCNHDVPIRHTRKLVNNVSVKLYRAADIFKSLRVAYTGKVFKDYKLSPVYFKESRNVYTAPRNTPYLKWEDVRKLLLTVRSLSREFKEQVTILEEKIFTLKAYRELSGKYVVTHLLAFPSTPIRTVLSYGIEYYCLKDILDAVNYTITPARAMKKYFIEFRNYNQIKNDKLYHVKTIFIDADESIKLLEILITEKRIPHDYNLTRLLRHISNRAIYKNVSELY